MKTHKNTFENLPEWVIEKWQDIADILAESIGVPATLVLKTEDEFRKVFISSQSENNPYHVGDKEKWHGLYCETVIKSQHKLSITNALKDKNWDKNPDIKLGMIAYMGFPLNFPNGQPFGTLCILDNKENSFKSLDEKLLLQFKSVIELDLALIQTYDIETNELSKTIKDQQSQLSSKNIELQKAKAKAEESEKRYSLLIDSVMYPVIVASFEGNILYINQKTADFLDVKVDEYHELKSLGLWADKAKRNEYIVELRAKGFILNKEVEFRNKHDQIITVIMSSNIIDYNGQKAIFSIYNNISERKKAEEELRESQRKLATLMGNLPGLAFRCMNDSDWTMMFISDGCFELTGFYPHELEGNQINSYGNLIHSDDAEMVWQKVQDAINSHTFWKIEYRIHTKDGKEKWVWEQGCGVYSNTGELEVLEGFISDITVRKLAEKALLQSHNLLKSTFTSLRDAVFVIDLKTTEVIDCNIAASEIFSYSQEEMIGKATEFLHVNTDTLGEFRTHLSVEIAEKGYLHLPEFEMKRKDGTIFPTEHSVTPLEDEQGVQYGWVSVVKDITERKKAEKLLQESEKNFKLMVSNSPDVTIIQDINGSAKFVSNHVREMFGYEPETFIGKPIPIEYIYPDDIETCINAFKALQAGTEVVNVEYRFIKATGEIIWLNHTARPIIIENVISGIQNNVRDITERKKAEEEIKFQNILLKTNQELSLDGILIVDDKGNILSNNKKFQELWEIPQEVIDSKSDENAYNSILHLLSDPKEYIEKIEYLYRVKIEKSFDEIQLKNGKIIERYSAPMLGDSDQYFGRIWFFRDITERKRTEDQIHKSEEKFSKIFHISPEVISINRLSDGRYIDANDACVRKTGYTREELIGKTSIELNIWADPEERIKYIHALEKDGKVRNLEMRLRVKSGEVLYFLASTEIIEVEEEKCILGYFFDITERKKAEEVLQATTAKLETIIMVSPLAITVIDINGNIQLWNKAAEQIFGWTAQEVIGHPNPVVPVDKQNEYATWSSRILQGETITNQEAVRVRKDGSLVNISFSSTSILDVNGNLIGRMAILTDITERKRLEDNLKQSEERLSGFINSATDSFYLFDAKFNIVEINRKALEDFGVQKIDMIGKNMADIDPTVKSSGRLEKYREVIKTGNPFTIIDFKALPRFGNRQFVVNAFKVGTGLGIIVYDITLIRKQEFELKKLLKAIESTEVSIVVTNIEGNIEYANPFFTQLTSYSEDEYLGKTPRVLKSGIHSDEYYKALWDTIKSGHTWEGEFCNRKKNGELYWEKSIITPIKNEKEEIVNFVAVKSDISHEKKHEHLDDITLEIYEKSEYLSVEEVLKLSIELGIQLTDSEIGFFHFVNEDQETISLQAWSAKTMDMCNVPTLDKHYPISKAGVWVDCFYKKKPVYHNDYSSLSHKKGLPEGHATLTRDLAVPVIVDNKIVAIFGVGNKESDYTEIEAEFLSVFAENVWNVVRRKKSEFELIDSKDQIQRYASHLQDVREEEKISIAREIHDDLGQILVALQIDMGLLKNKVIKTFPLSDSPEILPKFDNIVELIKRSIKTARSIMNGLRPELLELRGLVGAVNEYLREFEERYHISCEFNDDIPEIEMTPEQSLALFRILQEAMNNIVKHAKATLVSIQLQSIDNKVALIITDNGVGFDKNNSGRNDSYGMIGMKERVVLLKGELEITSEIGHGTTIRVEIPF